MIIGGVGIVRILWITLMAAGLVTLTAMGGWVILHATRRFFYHWRYAAHVIGATWEPEPIPGFIGSMMIEDDQEWDGGTFAFAPAPVDWPEDQPEPAPGPGDVTVEFFEDFPRWEEPARTVTPPNPAYAADLRALDNDAAAFMAEMFGKYADARTELRRKLAAA